MTANTTTFLILHLQNRMQMVATARERERKVNKSALCSIKGSNKYGMKDSLQQ